MAKKPVRCARCLTGAEAIKGCPMCGLPTCPECFAGETLPQCAPELPCKACHDAVTLLRALEAMCGELDIPLVADMSDADGKPIDLNVIKFPKGGKR